MMLQQFGHLHPGFEHFAAVDALHGGAFENHVVDQIEGDRVFGNTQQRSAAALAQHLEALVNRGGMAAHFQQDVDARAFGRLRDARDNVALRGRALRPRPFFWPARGDADLLRWRKSWRAAGTGDG